MMSFAIRNAANCGPFTPGCSQANRYGTLLFWDYDKQGTGVWDKIANGVVEAFSGAHDFFNNIFGGGYGTDGFALQGASFGDRLWIDGMNVVNIPLAAPFALSTLIDPAMVPFLQAYYDSLRK
jgi:hypothetical protein